MDEELNVQAEPVINLPYLENMAVWNLLQASSWMKFLSILAFVGCGLMLLAGLFLFVSGQALNSMNIPFFAQSSVLTLVLYLLIVVIMLFPAYYLYEYSQKLKNFGMTGDIQNLTKAFEYQKKYWKFNGIFIIIYLSVMLLIILSTFIFLAFR